MISTSASRSLVSHSPRAGLLESRDYIMPFDASQFIARAASGFLVHALPFIPHRVGSPCENSKIAASNDDDTIGLQPMSFNFNLTKTCGLEIPSGFSRWSLNFNLTLA